MTRTIAFISFLLLSCQPNKKESFNTVEVGGLILPDTLIASEQVKEMHPNGDGYLLYNYKINRKLIEEVRPQKDFASLPFKQNEVVDNRIYDYLSDQDEGYYIIRHLDDNDPRDQMVVVLNVTRMELTILMVYV